MERFSIASEIPCHAGAEDNTPDSDAWVADERAPNVSTIHNHSQSCPIKDLQLEHKARASFQYSLLDHPGVTFGGVVLGSITERNLSDLKFLKVGHRGAME